MGSIFSYGIVEDTPAETPQDEIIPAAEPVKRKSYADVVRGGECTNPSPGCTINK
jgi:hypothetical protein